jgi:hypothetical protein
MLYERNQTADVPTAVQPPVSPIAQQPAQQGTRIQLAEHAEHAKAMRATIRAAPIPQHAAAADCASAGAVCSGG